MHHGVDDRLEIAFSLYCGMSTRAGVFRAATCMFRTANVSVSAI